MPPPPPPPRTSSLYSLSPPHTSNLSTRSTSNSSVASFTSILATRPSKSSPSISMPPSVLSPVDVDCEVFLPAAVQLKGENPPTVLSPIDVDTAVEQLASSVRRISLEQDALFNVFRSGRITEGARRGRRSSSEGGREGERECSEEVRDGVRQDDSTSRGEKTQVVQPAGRTQPRRVPAQRKKARPARRSLPRLIPPPP